MTEIEKKALTLLNKMYRKRGKSMTVTLKRYDNAGAEALCRVIEQNEALKAENERLREEIARLHGPATIYRKGFGVGDGDAAILETGQ